MADTPANVQAKANFMKRDIAQTCYRWLLNFDNIVAAVQTYDDQKWGTNADATLQMQDSDTEGHGITAAQVKTIMNNMKDLHEAFLNDTQLPAIDYYAKFSLLRTVK